MAIKKSESAEKRYEISIAKDKLRDLLKNETLKELSNIQLKINNIINDLDNVAFVDGSAIKLEGKVYTGSEIRELIVEASGYTKWSKDWDEEELSFDEIEDIKMQFNVDFDLEEVKKYIYSRNTNSRDDLSMIIVTALPDYFEVELHTNRAGYGLKGLVDKAELLKGIEEES